MQLYLPPARSFHCRHGTGTGRNRFGSGTGASQPLRREVGHHAGLFDVALHSDFFRAGLQLCRCLPEVEVAK